MAWLMMLKRWLVSNWLSTLLIILVTQYCTMFYYSRETTEAQKVSVEADMVEPRKVFFPINKLYYPDKVEELNGTRHSTTKPVNPSVKSNVQKRSDGKRLILAWTVLHSKKPLWGITSASFRYCQYKNCEITGNRSSLTQADLVIFRIRELKSNMTAVPYRAYVRPLIFSDLPPRHSADQMWMEINQESPVYTHADEEIAPLNGMFNLSSNYLRDSDYSISYIPDVKPKVKSIQPRQPVDYSAGKTKMALWFVSHCHASSGRDEYVAELQKYNISVDIFGKCQKRSDGCKYGNHTCYHELRQKYKFYLAFENSICNEYITEKFWNTLTSDSYNIPIALGASLKEYEQFSPPNSFLHTRNFTSVKALADFMRRVDGDSEAFNSYHRWRETHEIVPSPDKSLESLQCYMCRQANEKKEGKNDYKNISTYWSRRNNCEIEPEPIK